MSQNSLLSSKEFNVVTNNLPLVSVILPTYNCAAFLPHSIGSILAQTYNSYEIIVVDDGSTDNTKESYICYTKDKVCPLEQNRGAI